MESLLGDSGALSKRQHPHLKTTGMRHPRCPRGSVYAPPSMKASALSRDTSSRTTARVVFSLAERIFSLSCISTKARFVNRAMETLVPPTIYSVTALPTMIRSSDPAIARGSKAPNQPSDGVASTRVAPGRPCLRTSCAYAAPRRSIQYIRTANFRAMATLATACPLRNFNR